MEIREADRDAIERVIVSLETENKEREKLIEENKLAIAVLRKQLSRSNGTVATLPRAHNSNSDDSPRFEGMRRPRAAAVILERAGQPLTLEQIGHQLNAAGLEVNTDNHFTALYTALSRNDAFRLVSGRGRAGLWALSKWPERGEE